MMNNEHLLIQSSKLLNQSTDLIWLTMRLQRQIKDCSTELSQMILGRFPYNKIRVRDLEDEIFGCRVEIQSLYVKVQRLMDKAYTFNNGLQLQKISASRRQSTYLSWDYNHSSDTVTKL
jgi:hypothetical protein